jgi:hypothetical protein
MSDYHEPPQELDETTRNYTRALSSLKEEVEAVFWYNERAQLSQDTSLKRILLHNRDEEMEHASMTLEWLRRNMPGWDDALRTYLFTEKDIVSIEDEEEAGEAASGSTASGLGIGKIKDDSEA